MKQQKRHIRAWVLLIGLFCLALVVSLFLGRYQAAPGTSALEAQYRYFLVLAKIRLPRILAAALVGAALSTAGASYQGCFRNPMVSPDLLGAASGAGFGAALAILCAFQYWGITLSAFVFGLLAVALAGFIGRRGRGDRSLSLVLAGIVVSALFTGGTSFIKLVADTDSTLPAITYWLMGSLSSIRGADVRFAAVPIGAGLVVLFLLRWRLNLLTMGEDEARSMGVNTNRLRLAVILAATLMTSASVAISGMIGWIGLVIPHFVRILFGYDYRQVIPASALLGAAFLIAVDDVARVAATAEIPIGILTSFIGAPIFILLITKGEREYAPVDR